MFPNWIILLAFQMTWAKKTIRKEIQQYFKLFFNYFYKCHSPSYAMKQKASI